MKMPGADAPGNRGLSSRNFSGGQCSLCDCQTGLRRKPARGVRDGRCAGESGDAFRTDHFCEKGKEAHIGGSAVRGSKCRRPTRHTQIGDQAAMTASRNDRAGRGVDPPASIVSLATCVRKGKFRPRTALGHTAAFGEVYTTAPPPPPAAPGGHVPRVAPAFGPHPTFLPRSANRLAETRGGRPQLARRNMPKRSLEERTHTSWGHDSLS